MNLGPTEILLILVIVVLLFGAKKLPDAARSLGRSMRIFKSEVKEMSNDDQRYEEQQQQRQIAAQAQQQVVNPVEIPQPQPTDIQRPQQ
ncbi:Sec-independent protein translocase subunit TatA [Corynebacterium diphtheriae bv. mitis]|uniref:Sec-independent protein translocase protein TatA n=7 Tax=Corynebacterium TaxID=1716 RepID=TATA_CORDI|nr:MULTISPECIES: Sec-independent protein translocase subunit TatA [Corynebacterium]Q6NH98.1 RecName: Full=Sec-independent protein translocase protein TatA [Corynebacterium diphtheriae NCTC 13129]ERA55623.1 twin arginine translocase protein A [Corynebacterium diphtheriae DSM 43988]OLN15449.1 Sec-independent protein translocase TatA [Corynebacterium diphtheriae subsp. lausannense]AEX41928.1 twin arginine translocase protein A [Corynebacterium diphtheriae 31A]AEX46454.1 twin arginine translocase 